MKDLARHFLYFLLNLFPILKGSFEIGSQNFKFLILLHKLNLQYNIEYSFVQTDPLQKVMEEKKAKTKQYLKNLVRPFISPIIEEIDKERPDDLLNFTYSYLGKLINARSKSNKTVSDESMNSEEKNKIEQEMKNKIKKKGAIRDSRKGVSAQVYGDYNIKSEFKQILIEKDSETRNRICELIKKSMILGFLGENQITIIVNAMSVENIKANESVIKEKENGEKLYIVGSGQYKCSKVINQKQTHLKTYTSGESFGELALMYNAPRAATIKCSKPGVLYALDRLTFKHIVEDYANNKRQKFMKYLEKVKILTQIDPYQKEQLCDILSEKSFKQGEYVVKEGEEGKQFYIVIEGKLIAEQKQKKVFEFGQGDYFGQIALIKNTPRQASVKCTTSSCRVLSLQRQSFKRILGPLQQIMKRNQEKYDKFLNS